MNYRAHRIDILSTGTPSSLGGVRQRIAKALLGQAVSLMVNPKKITQGIVTNVLIEADIPEIVVEGMRYKFNQILTACPAALG